MGNRIEAALLRKNGGNQSEMARFVGVSPQAVQKWISGETEPKGNNLKKAAGFLGVSEAVLRYGDAAEMAKTMQLQQVPAPYAADQRPTAAEVVEMADAFSRIASPKVRAMLLKSAKAAAEGSSITHKAPIRRDN